MTTDLIPRATIEEMVARRNKALDKFQHAFGKIVEADEAIKAAWTEARHFQPETPIGYIDARVEEVARFRSAVQLPDAGEYGKVAQKILDINFWTWIVEKGDLQRLMDVTAKEKLKQQLSYVPPKPTRWGQVIDEDEMAKSFPPVTVENVAATVESFMGQAGMIFRRGIAVAFSRLDRRFRSHDGFKVGSRVILTNFCDGHHITYGSGKREMLQDIERVFTVLEGKDLKPDAAAEGAVKAGKTFTSTEWAIEQACRAREAFPFVVTTDYFRVRVFQNGNAHLWMLNDGLVAKVNRLLGEYYGETVADGQTKDDPLSKTKGPLAKRDFDLFPTPDRVRDEVIEKARLHRDKDAPRLRVLEPSAGLGNLAIAALKHGAHVTCVELQPDRARALRSLEGIGGGGVYHADFLSLSPQTTGLFDRVIMNPPFSQERDLDHVNHAIKFLKPGGILVAVMSAGTEFRETKKAIAFRAMVEKMPADSWSRRFEDLPAGSFSEVGTNINTIILTVRAPEAAKAKEVA